MSAVWSWLLRAFNLGPRYLVEFESSPGVTERHVFQSERDARDAFPLIRPTRLVE